MVRRMMTTRMVGKLEVLWLAALVGEASAVDLLVLFLSEVEKAAPPHLRVLLDLFPSGCFPAIHLQSLPVLPVQLVAPGDLPLP
jgi:hypothetical protein